jgi:GNAT superfamily N-acetyltransferase
MAIELIDGRPDTESVSRIVSEVLGWLIFEPDAIDHMRAQTPTRRDWVGVLDGDKVGVGACAVPIGLEGSRAAWSMLFVQRDAPHRGVGGMLYGRVSEHARELGRSELQMFSFEDDPDTAGFAERHGFEVVGRVCGLRLPLKRCPRPELEPPEGVTITTLAERPELARGVWETACEAFPEIPQDEPMQAGS